MNLHPRQSNLFINNGIYELYDNYVNNYFRDDLIYK